MSDDNSIERLVSQLLDQMSAMRRVISNQNELIVGIKALLENHTQALRAHQRIIEKIGDELGVTFDDAAPDAQPGSPLN